MNYHNLAIDPGISSGFAVYNTDGDLVTCHGGRMPPLSKYAIRNVIIELPQVYTRRHSKGDPNDLITLAVQVGEYKYHFETFLHCKVTLVKPAEWKGQLEKDVCHAQYWPTLKAHEQAVVKYHGKDLSEKSKGDMLDAVCLGKWAARKGVFK